MPPPTDRKPGPALFLDGAATQQHLCCRRGAFHSAPSLVSPCPQKHWPFLFTPPIQRSPPLASRRFHAVQLFLSPLMKTSCSACARRLMKWPHIPTVLLTLLLTACSCSPRHWSKAADRRAMGPHPARPRLPHRRGRRHRHPPPKPGRSERSTSSSLIATCAWLISARPEKHHGKNHRIPDPHCRNRFGCPLAGHSQRSGRRAQNTHQIRARRICAYHAEWLDAHTVQCLREKP